jgi:hypothetical protein
MGGDRRGTRRHPRWRRPHPYPRSHGNPRHHRARRSSAGLALDRPAWAGAGGFYSYDALENLVGCHIHSADRVVPEWQDLKVGDQVKLHPEVGLGVAVVEPGRALVLRGGVPMGAAPPPYDFTWAFVVRERPDGTTRLLVRERYVYTQRWAPVLVEPVAVVAFVMSQRMLRGIRDRAERAGRPTA